jgi:short-subunit dehydrogenase
LHGFFDALRAELGHQNIRVTLICPGFIRTQISVNALTGDGSRQNKMDDAQANGMSAETCAIKILRAVDRGKLEAYIGGKEVLGVYLKRFFPRILAKVIAKAKVT